MWPILTFSQITQFSILALLKKAGKTMFAMEMQLETYKIFNSLLKIKILNIFPENHWGGGAATPIIHVTQYDYWRFLAKIYV